MSKWFIQTIGDISGTREDQRWIAVIGPRRRGRTNVSSYARGRAPADAGRGGDDVPSRPQDRHPLGEGWEVDVNPDAGGASALPRGRGPRSAGGDPAAAVGVTLGITPIRDRR